MTGGAAFWVLLGGLSVAVAVMLLCRAHWFALLGVMYHAPHDLLQRLGWPREHPFDLRDPANPKARKFPKRRLRSRVMFLGLPRPDLCPPAAQRHARAFRLWGALLLALLLSVAAWAISPMVFPVALGLYVCGYAFTPKWHEE